MRSTGGDGSARYVGIGSVSRACTRTAGKVAAGQSRLSHGVVLLWLTPQGTWSFWLTLVALLGLIAMHAVYWVVTHPVNKFWLQQENLGGFGSGFFSFGANCSGPSAGARPWTALRDRWEYSHVARAGFACVSLIALLIAVSDGS